MRRRASSGVGLLLLVSALSVTAAAGGLRTQQGVLIPEQHAETSVRSIGESDCDLGGAHCLHQNADHAMEELAAAERIGSPKRGKGCILILAQNTKSDQLYERDSMAGLTKTLRLIYKNYNHQWREDVVLAHTGDFDIASQARLVRVFPEVKFLLLDGPNWSPHPKGIERTNASWYGMSKWGIGYRSMCRFFAVRIWPVLRAQGYRWVMRFDDDSYLLSPIRYNIFGFMELNGLKYGYRAVARDLPHGDQRWHDELLSDNDHDAWYRFVREYVARHRDGNAGWLLDSCWLRLLAGSGSGAGESAGRSSLRSPRSLRSLRSPRRLRSMRWPQPPHSPQTPQTPSWRLDAERVVGPTSTRGLTTRRDGLGNLSALIASMGLPRGEPPYLIENCGIPWGVYTNFFVADLERFTDADVQDLLQSIDDSGYIYSKRWGDLNIQSTVAQLLFAKAEVHHFTDFAYGHNSGDASKLHFGLVQASRSETLEQQVHSMRAYYRNELNWTFDEEVLREAGGMVTATFPAVPVCTRFNPFRGYAGMNIPWTKRMPLSIPLMHMC
jgi:hypothetical protein